jgi:hypothetical protein
MARPEISHVRGGVLACALVSIALAACSSSSGKPNVVDSGGEVGDVKAQLVTDGGDAKSEASSVDRGKTDTGTETGHDALDTGTDHGPDGATMDGATNTGGAAGMGGAGMGGGTGTGGVIGTGGADAGVDTQPDSPMSDAGPNDVVTDSSPTDSSGDTTPACGTGCPSTIQADHLVLWLAADFGVTCTSGHVSAWQDRGGSNLPVAPVSGKNGPQCGIDQIAGRAALFFDRPGNDDNDGVLTVALDQILTDTDYTVFVVERRKSDTDGYVLGTGGSGVCDSDTDMAYRFGYNALGSPPMFIAGPYSFDNEGDLGCLDPAFSVAAYSASAPAALEIETFDSNVGHSLLINGTAAGSNTDMNPITSLSNPFIGRAFDAPAQSAHHSRYLGDVGEIVIYDAALGTADRNSVAAYLKQRWSTGP